MFFVLGKIIMNFFLKLGMFVLPIPFSVVALYNYVNKDKYPETSERFWKWVVCWIILHVFALAVCLVWIDYRYYTMIAIINTVLFLAIYGPYSLIKKLLGRNKKKSAKESDAKRSFSKLDNASLNEEYVMTYRDSSNNVTQRNIILHAVEYNAKHEQYIKAFCLMRKSTRTFKVSNIVTLYSAESGEVVV